MPRQTEFERRIAAIDELVQQLEAATDPAARAASQELVRALMELHGAALERMLTTIRRNGAAGGTIVDQLAQDELIASVLLLYDLHPVDLETRVRGALEKSRPYLKSHGGNVELVAIEVSGVVRLRMQGSCHGCPSSAVTLKLAIEQAIYEAAPDVSAIVVEGQVETPHPAATVLVALEAARTNGHGEADAIWQDVPELGRLANGATRRAEVGGRAVLFCRLEENLYAYGARCPECDADISAATLAGRTLSCPGCGQAYDVVQAGRAPDRPELHLDPFPLLTRNGRTQVALPALRVAATSA
jgi:Fe-S cluster biogenesis protein NfuA/nitrite reductase/ring-hydroxylating ferredoxin subunit